MGLAPSLSMEARARVLLQDKVWPWRAKLTGENLKVVWAEFSSLSWAVLQNVYNCMA